MDNFVWFASFIPFFIHQGISSKFFLFDTDNVILYDRSLSIELTLLFSDRGGKYLNRINFISV